MGKTAPMQLAVLISETYELGKTWGEIRQLPTEYKYSLYFSKIVDKFSGSFPKVFPKKLGVFPQVFFNNSGFFTELYKTLDFSTGGCGDQ